MTSPSQPTAAEIASRLPEDEAAPWREEIGKAARQAVEEEIARLDPKHYGYPVWPRAEDALFPAAPGGKEGTCELAAFLVREAKALRELGAPSSVADDEEMALREMLSSRLWDEEFLLFATPDGDAADDTPGGYFPVLVGGWEESVRDASAERAGEVFSSPFWTAEGCVVFAVLAGEGRLAEAMAGTLRVRGKPWREAWEMVAGRGRKRRKAAARLVFAGAVLAAALAGGAVFAALRGGKTAASGEAAARELCRKGDHAAAAALYAASGDAYGAFRAAGEWLHAGEPAKAEALYRELLASGEGGDAVRMNLALALSSAGKNDEAEALYREIEEAGGPASSAAGKAANLLEDLRALAP